MSAAAYREKWPNSREQGISRVILKPFLFVLSLQLCLEKNNYYLTARSIQLQSFCPVSFQCQIKSFLIQLFQFQKCFKYISIQNLLKNTCQIIMKRPIHTIKPKECFRISLKDESFVEHLWSCMLSNRVYFWKKKSIFGF